MQPGQFVREEEAVSPVVGVVLMTAITVLLAAGVGTFALGLSDETMDGAPAVSFEYDYAGSGVVVTHAGGDTLDGSNLRVTPSAVSVTGGSELTAGDEVANSGGTTVSGTVRIIWENPNGDGSHVIGRDEPPA